MVSTALLFYALKLVTLKGYGQTVVTADCYCSCRALSLSLANNTLSVCQMCVMTTVSTHLRGGMC